MEDIARDSDLTPKESEKDKGKAEENLETEPKMVETDKIIIDAQPLSWRPPEDHDQYPLLMPVFIDGQVLGLPEGWKVERRPRTSLKYLGKTDQYFYEPGTKRQFRSMKAVQRHLGLIAGKQHEQQPRPRQENDGQTPLLIENGDPSEGLKEGSGGHSRKKLGKKRKQASSGIEFDFAKPPEKETWALTDAENDKWNPIDGEKLAPEAVKGLWAETFESVVHQKNKAPEL